MKKISWAVFAAVVAALVAITLRKEEGVRSEPPSVKQVETVAVSGENGEPAHVNVAAVKKNEAPAGGDAEVLDVQEPQTEEEKAEAVETAKVDAFDNLTDKWMEPSKQGVTMEDVDTFSKAFKEVPKSRQDECIHRALNLVPDENVMLLAGILMDKSVDKDIVETVFNDILNRDEDVKKTIMKEIFKDKTHPCWADVAWILDVTGEKSK